MLIFTAREQIAEESRIADQDARHEVDMLGEAMRPALRDAWRLGGAERLQEIIGETTASERVVRLRWVQAVERCVGRCWLRACCFAVLVLYWALCLRR